MIIKEKDSVEPQIRELNNLLKLKNLTNTQREQITFEISNVKKGDKGERETAYHLNTHLGNSKNIAIIHDFRIEIDGQSAQIDHLIINRFFEFDILETKNIKADLRMTPNDDFEIFKKSGWEGMASPVEQNKRHIKVLEYFLDQIKIIPEKAGGIKIEPIFNSWVLVPTSCNITRRMSEMNIVKMDSFCTKRSKVKDKESESFLHALKFIFMRMKTANTLEQFASNLACFHTPSTPNYKAKFKIPTS